MRGRFRTRDERGATLVEFALIAPILFMILFAMLDIGLAIIGSSIATNAAREGARTGIINFNDADIEGSANYNVILAAAEEKLVGPITRDTSSGPYYLTVRCLDGDDQDPIIHAGFPAGTCNSEAVRVDHDLIEVTVNWRSVSPYRTPLTEASFTNVARMVITGGIGGGGGESCTPGGPVSVADGTFNEADGTVSLTVTRQTASNCPTTASLTYNNISASDDDYDAPSGVNIGTGTTATIEIAIVDDPTPEGSETFEVTLGNITNGTPADPTALVTINASDTVNPPPTFVSLSMWDNSDNATASASNGKVDRLIATFSEDVQGPCTGASLGEITFAYPVQADTITVQQVQFNGTNTAVILLNEGTRFDTSDANLRVSLDAGCIRAEDNGADVSFTSETPGDEAPPVLITVVDDDTAAVPPNAANGRFERNDWVQFTFSEALNPSTLGVTNANVIVSDPNGGGNDTMSAAGLFSASTSLGGDGYLTQNNSSVSFPTSAIEFQNNNTRIQLTLTNNCAQVGAQNRCGQLAQGVGDITFTFVATLRGADTLALSPRTFTGLRLF